MVLINFRHCVAGAMHGVGQVDFMYIARFHGYTLVERARVRPAAGGTSYKGVMTNACGLKRCSGPVC